MKTLLVFIFLFVLVIACLAAAGYGIYRLATKPNTTVVQAFEEGTLNLVIEGNIVKGEEPARITDGAIFLTKEVILEYIDPNLNWDKELHKLTITTKNKVIRMKTDSLDAYVNNEAVALNFPVVEDKNGSVYVPVEFLSDFYGIEIQHSKDTNTIIIDFKNKVRQLAEPIDANAVIRTGRSERYPILKKLSVSASYTAEGILTTGTSDEANSLRVFEEYDGWYRVRTSEGIVGYIEKKYVVVRLVTVQGIIQDREESAGAAWKPDKGKINLVWDYVGNAKSKYADRTKIEGLDVISPTWFQVSDEEGNVKNKADAEYVKWAHNNGYKVWALFSNSLGGAEATGRFLADTDARDNSIRQLLAFAALYGIDGVNVDFEDLQNSDKDALTQYIRELAPLLREQGLIVSIDINGLACYDREKLGEAVDFVALMAYDQHWKGGGEAGSVAEFAWSEDVVNKFLKTIPAEKLLFGMPFYTRLWKQEPASGNSTKLTSQALSMDAAKKLVDENKADVVWDEECGQFYAEYIKDGAKFMVWLEDVNSINLRTSLVHKYSLAGVASWRLDFEVPAVWGVINENIKNTGGYTQWKQRNN
ncbi:MAG: glycoside hydrolase [Clostridiales bacterium]|nr:glycoside hydrolase [Clostridiales bacterium]